MLINETNKAEKSTCPHLRGILQLLKSEYEKISYEDDPYGQKLNSWESHKVKIVSHKRTQVR